ncbi:type VII secretion protein EccB [Streptacidiphilus griseoplanus]|uniref:type VII secretion protein EccB n=1 Tax=Peterkaempfera griseoplana TaxID=66896 RepID=UPI0006E3E434|nr:type VII secretion protein EccB [Peterkaempfera griseoplana]
MASRRDELNAYTFARRRMVGAFLQPAGGGNDEDAPRPVRAVVPSLVMAAVVVAGFGMWGMIKPAAPQGWDDGKSIVVGKESTTRYVVLTPDPNKPDEKTLYPVLNMASAKLVLDADSKVTFVEDKVLDQYARHGATIGIPYAPDKLPTAEEASKPKVWTVCDRPGGDAQHTTVNQAVFVLSDTQAAALRNPGFRLAGGNGLFVQSPGPDGKGGEDYLVDATGTKHSLGAANNQSPGYESLRSLLGTQLAPQRVTDQWLSTLADGHPITFPRPDGLQLGSPTNVRMPNRELKVGNLLSYDSNGDGNGDSFYVVGRDQIYLLTDFEFQLFMVDPGEAKVYGSGSRPRTDPLTSAERTRWAGPVGNEHKLAAPADWPKLRPDHAVNGLDSDGGTRNVLCSTYEGIDEQTHQLKRSVWAASSFPASVTNGSSGAHVTPGTGLLYRAMEGAAGNKSEDVSGSVYLLTETGLRYQVVANGDSTAKSSVLPKSSQSQDPSGQAQGQGQQGNDAQARLGYKDIQPGVVPRAWSDLVPSGPNLDTKSALQPQTS